MHGDLVTGMYRHGPYQAFFVHDPKRRHIHKAGVRDRVLHHAIHRILYPSFDRVFVYDSFSCRIGKGVHAALRRFQSFGRGVGLNGGRTCWVLQCDIRKFFDSIDHDVLLDLLSRRVSDRKLLALLSEVIGSFSAKTGKGIPLGNLTSQLFANVYLNEFDQFVKHRLRATWYLRYADDFVIMSPDKEWLQCTLFPIRLFLSETLILELHPKKVSFKTLASGVDWLGWIHFPDHRILRRALVKRMRSRVFRGTVSKLVFSSYEGLCSHGNTKKCAARLQDAAHFLGLNLF